ncbi:MAG TPA: hypothetical protein VF707_18140 [Ardenticatenaceae bacterium]|jgi:hypothetical protein
MADQNATDEQRQDSTGGSQSEPATPSQAEGERGDEGIERSGRDNIGADPSDGPGSSSQADAPNTPSQAEG